jgi:protein-S-isoprenylcysteine O-methyltransferase Ste14
VAAGSLAALVLTAALALLLDLKARREEAWLLQRLPGYGAYRARTHKFVPGIY